MTRMGRGLGQVGPVADIDFSSRRVLASYPDYASAQHTVDLLSDRGFDVSKTSIVGSDLLLVESVFGRLTTGRAAAAGAASGAWFGIFIGLIFGIATPYFWVPLLWGLILGAIFGAVFGAAGHAAYRGTRDFASTRTIVAQRYDVLVAADQWVKASSVLGAPVTGTQASAFPTPDPTFGSPGVPPAPQGPAAASSEPPAPQ
jgi:hypothetical protein